MVTADAVKILVVDDEKPTAEFIGSVLSSQNYQVTIATSADQAMSMIREAYFPIIVSDIQLGEPDGMALLSFVKKQPGDPSVLIFITGHGSVDTAVKAMQEGAFDYISKPINLLEIEDELISLVHRALKHLEYSKETAATPIPKLQSSSASMIGKSPQIVKVYRTIAKVAMSRSNVLITGESGTGKELVARAIHDNSQRASKPFVTVNCCALNENLLESELFGHVKGSFTGATGNKVGLFEEANHGTLFLDEIGDISPALQVKLLRVLQEGEIKPVGAMENRKVDVRVIAATHRNLETLVAEGKFRDDLYYRLKVILIEMPPLRERVEDLPELVKYFLARSSQKTGKAVSSVSEDLMKLILNYPWPGNIRELENSIERATAMSSSPILFPEDFQPELLKNREETTAPATEDSPVELAPTSSPAPRSLEELEKEHIIRTLHEVKFNKSKAASILGIDRVTLYRKASRYGIQMRNR